MTLEPIIGLEVHVQLDTVSKAFSPSRVAFAEPENSLTDPTVLGLPGALPVFNAGALTCAIKLGLAVGGEIARRSRFARKQYFYPDLPKGYQISQFDEPIISGGHIEFVLDSVPHRVELTRIHLEEDAGKNLHRGSVSLVDLNRAGVTLCEVVSEPVIRSADEAAEYMRALRRLVRCLGISGGNMEQGQLRCDANVSLRPVGESKLGTRTELKNINSFKFVKDAIENEVARQTDILQSGGHIVQETRLWDSDRGMSKSMRGKEEAMDYRYFPDPDLPPLIISEEQIAAIRSDLPELPEARRKRWLALDVAADDAHTLVGDEVLGSYVDEVVAAGAPAKLAVTWVLNEVPRGEEGAAPPISAVHLAELLALLEAETISGKIAKQVLSSTIQSGDSPKAIVERDGLVQITDQGALLAIAEKVVAENPGQAEQYRGGKTKLLCFFVGQVMKESGGKANPAAVNALLRKLLGEPS